MCIEELFVGAWVLADGDVEPCRVLGYDGAAVTCLCADGVRRRILLSDLRPFAVTSSVLRGFGFREAKGDNVWLMGAGDMRLTVGLRMRYGVEECRRCAIGGRIVCWNEEVRSVHELQRWWNERVYFPFGVSLDLVWHGCE